MKIIVHTPLELLDYSIIENNLMLNAKTQQRSEVNVTDDVFSSLEIRQGCLVLKLKKLCDIESSEKVLVTENGEFITQKRFRDLRNEDTVLVPKFRT